jgi:hypothetical protein
MGKSERPEHTAPPEIFYNEDEARKYTTNSRMINIQVSYTSNVEPCRSSSSSISTYTAAATAAVAHTQQYSDIVGAAVALGTATQYQQRGTSNPVAEAAVMALHGPKQQNEKHYSECGLAMQVSF